MFVADDRELGREVALKQIQDQFAHDPKSRSRFLFEARITAGLEHPGVVPVHGLGQSPDGRPYYAMRLIRGESLKEAIAGFHAAYPAGSLPASAPAPCNRCSEGSSTSATRWPTPTAGA